MALLNLGNGLEIELSDLVREKAERLGVALAAIDSEGTQKKLNSQNGDYSVEISGRFSDEDFRILGEIADKLLNPVSDDPASQTTIRPHELPYQKLCLSIKYQQGLVGFATNILYSHEGRSINYFSGVAITEEHQGRGLFGIVQAIGADAADSDVLITRTMNPKVIASFERLKEGYIPFPSGTEAPDMVKTLARNLFFHGNGIPPTVDTTTLVWQNCYRGIGDRSRTYDARLLFLVKPEILQQG